MSTLLPPIPSSPSAISASSKSLTANTAGSNYTAVTDDQKLLSMLGYKDLNKTIGSDGSVYYREEFCGACGILHNNPGVLDTYINCRSCHNVIREPSVLREKYRDEKPTQPLEILFATYGDPYDPITARDVTELCKLKIKEFHTLDRIAFRTKEKLSDYFGFDPAPGKNKQLRIRYRIGAVHAMLMLDFDPDNKIPQPFLLMAPRRSYLRIYSASYGHPCGATTTGRMHFDVLEVVQSLIDQNNGSYLVLSSYTPLSRIFGDPCPGYTKDLRLHFEVVGRSGELKYNEIRGFLMKKIFVESSPTIAPLIYILSAFYGITPTAKKDRLEYIQKQLKSIRIIEHRREQGLPVQPEEVRLLKLKTEMQRQLQIFLHSPTKFIDVREKIQKLADKGEYQLILDKERFDPNEVFGNPLPGIPKILEVYVDCEGHDSEKMTETMEMMDTGIVRNVITIKKHRYNIVVEDEEILKIGGITAEGKEEDDKGGRIIVSVTNQQRVPFTPEKKSNNGSSCSSSSLPPLVPSAATTTPSAATLAGTPAASALPVVYRGRMQESLIFQTDYAAPIIIIKRATFGELADIRKCIDVTSEIQSKVKGRVLKIAKDVNLHTLFRMDPSPGRKKQLHIHYITRGFTGNLRVRERKDCLVAGIELGYPPVPPPDDDSFIVTD